MANILNGPNQDDADWLRDFQKQWGDNTRGDNPLSDTHPVIRKVKRWSKVVAYRFGNRQLAGDLEQNCLIALSKIEFRGESKLDTLIFIICRNLNLKMLREGEYEQLDEIVEMPDTSSEEFLKAVLARLSWERFLKKLLEESNEVRRTVIEIILEAKEIIGRQRIALIATERLGKKVTRHQVEVILRQLRDHFTDGSSGGAWAP